MKNTSIGTHVVSYNVGDQEFIGRCGQREMRCTHQCPDAPREAFPMEQFKVIDHVTYKTLCLVDSKDTIFYIGTVVGFLP